VPTRVAGKFLCFGKINIPVLPNLLIDLVREALQVRGHPPVAISPENLCVGAPARGHVRMIVSPPLVSTWIVGAVTW
jgi:hypothetical protein